MKRTNFKGIRHIPHFYMIRSVESRLLSDYIDKSEGPFLDLGCGDGNFGRTLDLKEVYGVDIDENAIESNTKNSYIKAVVANASRTPFPDSFFATVFSNCAIEHMDRLSDVLKEVNRVVKDHGKFIFTVPTKKFMEILRQDEILKGIGLNGDESVDAYNKFHHHVNIYDLGQWKIIIEKAGFNLIKYEYYLPGEIGSFIARMDMLYTVEVPGSKEILKNLEKKYKSFAGLPFRMKFKKYLKNPHCDELATHLLVMAEKS